MNHENNIFAFLFNDGMTVCIGTLCTTKDKKCDTVIVASDRMVTFGGFMEFEHDSPKVTEITPRCMALIAGDALRGSKLIDELKKVVTETDEISKIVDKASSVYINCRERQIDADIFKPRGFSRNDFYLTYQQKILPQLSAQLDQMVSQYNYGVSVLLAGVDETGGHIYTIDNPGGSPTHNNQLGYSAIGSGAIHSLQSLIGFKHSDGRNIENTLFYIYASKRRGEVAPGVGKDTDMFIIKKDGIKKIEQVDLTELEKIYDEYNHPIENTVFDKVKKLNLFNSIQNGES